jgi:hypothetical protein
VGQALEEPIRNHHSGGHRPGQRRLWARAAAQARGNAGEQNALRAAPKVPGWGQIVRPANRPKERAGRVLCSDTAIRAGGGLMAGTANRADPVLAAPLLHFFPLRVAGDDLLLSEGCSILKSFVGFWRVASIH